MSNTRKATSAKKWKQNKSGIELNLPSGNMCLVKRPGMERLLKAGVMPDSLTQIAMSNINSAESARPKSKKQQDQEEKAALEAIFQDQSKMADVFTSFDKVAAICVMEPQVRLHTYTTDDEKQGLIPEGSSVDDEIPEENRDDDILYTDDVDMEDKMFIFQFVVGGSSDLEQFRQERSAELAALESGS